MKIHFITFANTESGFSLDRIKYEAEESKYFDTITTYTEYDFDENYKKIFNGREKDKRGYGYMSWKSYIIKKKFDEIDYGDLLVYADCGCSIIPYRKNVFDIWVKKCINTDKYNILSPCFGPYLEKNWNKRSILEYVENKYNNNKGNLRDEVQCGSGVIFFFKNVKTIDFVNNFFDICNNHYDLCTDEPCQNEYPEFIENRHDQSAFSLLTHVYPIEYVNTEDGILDAINTPIYASRHKTDKNTWKKPLKTDNIDIFIYTHKDFKPIVSNPVYKILTNKNIKITDGNKLNVVYEDNYTDNISYFEYVYSELCGIYSIWKNYELKDYVGFCGYRKYFSFKDNTVNITNVVDNYGIICCPINLYYNIYEHYNIFHNINGLIEIIQIINEKYPSYSNTVNNTLVSKTLYGANMFIMKSDKFKEWCSFLFGILDEYNNRHNFNTKEDFVNYTKTFKKVNNNIGIYQSRIPGYLSERLFTIWVNHNFVKIGLCNMIELGENKLKQDENEG